MTTLKPYTAYRDSGVEWLGDVPEHWTVPRLKQICVGPPEYGANVSAQSYSMDGVRFVRTTDIREDGQLRTKGGVYVDESLVEDSLLEVGDFLVSRSGTIGRALVVDEWTPLPAAFAGYLVRFRTRDVPTAKWAYLFTQTAAFSGYIRNVVISSTIDNVNGQKYANMPIPLPPLDEQRVIAAFLDAMDARITRLIAARKKMIRLLEEKKQAVINQAVTKGLDPTVPMKDSGVDWLGEIPAHWEVPKIGHFARVGNGSTPSRGEPRYWISGVFPWLNSSSVHKGVIESTDQFVTELALAECHLPIVTPGDLLVAITGQGKTRGTVAIVNMTATINQHMAYISIRRPWTTSKFLQLALSGAYKYLREISSDSGSTKGALTCEDIRHFKVPVPPISEQEAIVAHTDRELCRIEEVIARSLKEIELMQEYRTRLISDVVTGKLDVRGVELPAIEAVVDVGLTAALAGEAPNGSGGVD